MPQHDSGVPSKKASKDHVRLPSVEVVESRLFLKSQEVSIWGRQLWPRGARMRALHFAQLCLCEVRHL